MCIKVSALMMIDRLYVNFTMFEVAMVTSYARNRSAPASHWLLGQEGRLGEVSICSVDKLRIEAVEACPSSRKLKR
jgi:hypothetical protein